MNLSETIKLLEGRPVVKKMGIIDQWGNGLKLIYQELNEYNNIEFKWMEKGLSLQIQFIKKTQKPESQPESRPESLERKILEIIGNDRLSKKEISERLGQKKISGSLNKSIRNLLEKGYLLRTIPEIPTSSKQKYFLSDKAKKK